MKVRHIARKHECSSKQKKREFCEEKLKGLLKGQRPRDMEVSLMSSIKNFVLPELKPSSAPFPITFRKSTILNAIAFIS
ncbi:hypothetical protein ACB092_11G129700 [Castanea dentata]